MPDAKRDRDTKPATKSDAQPKRRFDQLKDYRTLPRHQMEFGREINAADYWKGKLPETSSINPDRVPRR